MRNGVKMGLGLLLGAAAATAQPYGIDERVPNTSLLLSVADNPLVDMDLRRVFEQVSLSEPIFLTHAGDGSGRVFFVERAGRVKVLDQGIASVFLDISAAVNSGPQEAGLLGLAFHPDFADNGRFYVSYTRGSLVSRIAEFSVGEDGAVVADSERVVLEVNQPAGNHNGGQISFGTDGYLYISLGDGGGADDRFGNGQNLETLLGAMLRIDVDGRDAGLQYAVPADNPFANGEGGRPEIWAWGLRNVWRFGFDRADGALWAGDVGQNRREEIDIIQGGKNYGWNTMEGFECFEATSCDSEELELPVFDYPHSQGRSVTGGYVYRGTRLARLQGVYLYADFVTRRVWGLRRTADGIENRLLAISPGNVSSFGEDEAGEVYIVNFDGSVYVLDEKPDNPPALGIPPTISSSGLYADMATLEPAPGILPYGVNSQLWSDGAAKTRFIALPGEERIVFDAAGGWGFPPDAVLVKNFFLDMEEGNPDSRRIIETRFLVKRRDDPGWDGFSYIWNDEATEAVLLEADSTKLFVVTDASQPGGARLHEHLYPSREDCLVCHNPGAGYVLGVRTAQLNGDYDYGQVVDNQLRTLNHIGLFTEDIGEDADAWPRLVDPLAAGVDLDLRARSYLDVNCSPCHPGSIARTILDMRYDTPLDQTNLVDVFPTLGGLGAADPRILKEGAPDESTLYLRMLDLGGFRMPSVASSRVDEAGAAVVRQWIASLGGVTAVSQDSPPTPQDFGLGKNFPNPFNAATTIEFFLDSAGPAELVVFDPLGQRVRRLVLGQMPGGRHIVRWDGTDDRGQAVGSGVYISRLQQGQRRAVGKMLLLK